ALRKVVTKARDLGVAEMDVAVPRDVNERIVPELVVHQRDTRFCLVDLERSALPDRREQIRKAGRVRVPVAAAVVLEACDGEDRRSRTRSNPKREERRQEGEATQSLQPTETHSPDSPRSPSPRARR